MCKPMSRLLSLKMNILSLRTMNALEDLRIDELEEFLKGQTIQTTCELVEKLISNFLLEKRFSGQGG